MYFAISGFIADSDVLGLVAGGIAIAALCAAQILDLRATRGLPWKLASVVATLMCVLAVALVINRFAVLG